MSDKDVELNQHVEQQAARRIIGALWVFWCLLAVAAAMMLVNHALGSFAVGAAALVAGFVFFGFLWRSRTTYEWSRDQSIRWLAFLVRATGWNPWLAAAMLAVPLVVFVAILAWLTATGGPDFGDAA